MSVQIFFRSDNYGCEQGECFSYSIPELCGHSASDHNYFAVCSNILSPAPHSLNLLSSPVQRVRGNFGVFRNRKFTALLIGRFKIQKFSWAVGHLLARRTKTAKRCEIKISKKLGENIVGRN